MKLVHSRQALSDLTGVASYYTTTASPAIAEAIGRRLIEAVERIQQAPLSAPRIAQRSQIRAHPLSVIHFGYFTAFAATRSTSSTFATHPGDHQRG
jgi:plasmid stabilization system protein ParE